MFARRHALFHRYHTLLWQYLSFFFPDPARGQVPPRDAELFLATMIEMWLMQNNMEVSDQGGPQGRRYRRHRAVARERTEFIPPSVELLRAFVVTLTYLMSSVTERSRCAMLNHQDVLDRMEIGLFNFFASAIDLVDMRGDRFIRSVDVWLTFLTPWSAASRVNPVSYAILLLLWLSQV